MKKLISVLVILLLFAAVPAASANHDLGEADREIGTFNSVPLTNGDLLTITKVTEDDEIYLKGGCLEPQWTNLALSVTGYGGVEESAPDLDVVFAIDSSGSMGWNDESNLRLEAAKDFTVKLEDDADGVDYAGVVSWDSDIDFTYGLVSENDANQFDDLRDKIDTVDSSGGTDLNVGLNAAITMLDASGRADADAQVIIFLTDGDGTYTYGAGGPASSAAAKGYTIYSIGLGDSAASGPLTDMATATGGKYYSAPTAGNLQAIFDEIYQMAILSTAPYDPYVRETVQGHIVVDCANITPAPDACWKCPGGATHIEWNNVGIWNDNAEKYLLTADDTFEATIPIASTLTGSEVPIDDDTGEYCTVGWTAQVFYTSPDDECMVQDIPQAYIDVIMPVAVDIKPGSCPNAFNPNQKGVLPVAIAGDVEFDVTTIDPATVTLNGVAPLRWSLEDVTSPIYCPEDCEDCETACDGCEDLTLKFDSPEIAGTLGSVEKGDCIKAILKGETVDGVPFEGYDCLWITKDYTP